MEQTIKNIPTWMIVPSPRNPRKTFDEDALQELADNIKQQGLLQPVTIRPIEWHDEVDKETGEVVSVPIKYELVCGERRWRAVLKNNSETIPAIVRELEAAEKERVKALKDYRKNKPKVWYL